MSTTEQRVPYPEAVRRWPRLRQSLLAEFDRCPLQAKFSAEHATGWSSHDQARGILAHRVFAKCLEEMARHGEDRVSADVALAVLREVLRQHDVDARDVVAIPSEQLEDLHMSVAKWATDNVWDVANLVDVERRLTSTIQYPGPDGPVDRVLSGQLDALFFEPDERAIVLDWKDTWSLPPETEVSFSGYFQQRFYGLLVLDAYPKVQSVVLREFYVRYSEAREATLWRADLTEVREEMAALAERFDRAWETGHHRPSPGKHCSFCLRPSDCPIFPQARRDGAIASEDEARRVAAEAVVARAALDQRTRALKAWADRHGPVPVADAKGRRQFGYTRTTRTERPDRETMERALREAGVNRLQLDALYRQRSGTRFGEHTPPDRPTPEDAKLIEQLRASLDRIDQR